MGKSASCLVSRKADDIDTNTINIDVQDHLASVVPDKFILISTYFKMFININEYMIPQEIIKLCCKYCDLFTRYPPLILQNRYLVYIICDTNEHIFDHIFIAKNGYICSNRSILKLTVLGDLIMESESMIRMDSNIINGHIILNIFGCLHLKSHSQIAAKMNGNIYIKCNKLKMDNNSVIQTCDQNNKKSKEYNYPQSHDNNKIQINVRDSMKMKKDCSVNSGNIEISCGSIDMHETSKMNAFIGNIDIKADKLISIDSIDHCLCAKIDVSTTVLSEQ